MLLGISKQASNKIQHCTLNLPLSFPFKPLAKSYSFLVPYQPTQDWAYGVCLAVSNVAWDKEKIGYSQVHAIISPSMLQCLLQEQILRKKPYAKPLTHRDYWQSLCHSWFQPIVFHVLESVSPASHVKKALLLLPKWLDSFIVKDSFQKCNNNQKKTSLHIHVWEEWPLHFIYGY